MFSVRRLFALATLALLGTLSPDAYAQDDDSDAYQRMLDLSDEATDEVLRGNFEAGAITFRAAYRAFPDPVLLKNEMIAWYRAGDCHSALPPARTFLGSEKALPEDIADVRTVERDCRLTLAEDALATEDLPLASYHLDRLAELELPAEAQQRLVVLRTQHNALAPPAVEAAACADCSGWSTPPTSALALAGGGIAGALTGLSLHVVALQRQDELRTLSNSTDPNDTRRLRQRRAAWDGYQHTTRWLVPTLYSLSAAAIGAGIYLSLTAPPSSGDRTPARVQWAPAFGPDYSGAHLIANF